MSLIVSAINKSWASKFAPAGNKTKAVLSSKRIRFSTLTRKVGMETNKQGMAPQKAKLEPLRMRFFSLREHSVSIQRISFIARDEFFLMPPYKIISLFSLLQFSALPFLIIPI